MNLMRCKKGHFYDAEKYDTCPHCMDVNEKDILLPTELSLFKTQRVLGESRTSNVYCLIPKEKYALKVVDIIDSKMEAAVDHEYGIAQQLNGEKYFVDYYAMYKQNGKAYIVQPELRNLLTYIEVKQPNLQQILSIFEDITRAIICLEKKGIVHLDIKPTNIFVDASGNGKLGDFSTACEIIKFKENPFQGGTPKYFPPEVCEKSGYSGKEDMYSLEISMYYILSGGKYPYDFEEAETRTADAIYIVNDKIPEELQRIIVKATAYKPDDRYGNMLDFCDEIMRGRQNIKSETAFLVSGYYEADIAYTCMLPVESDEDRTVAGDHTSDAEKQVEKPHYENGGGAQGRRRALAEALLNGEPVAIGEDGSIRRKPITSSEENGTDSLNNNHKMAGGDGIQVPAGKLAGGPRICCACGARCNATARFCGNCGSSLDLFPEAQLAGPHSSMPDRTNDYPLGDDERGHLKTPSMNRGSESNYTQAVALFQYTGETTVLNQHAPLEISKVHFSAIAPRTLTKSEYTIIDIVMYQDAFRSVVDELIKEAALPVQEKKSGTVRVREGARVKIQLTSPDIEIEDNVEEQEWVGEYLTYNFAVMIPEKFAKRQVLFTATVYIDDLIATRLKFIAKCWSLRQQKIKVTQENVLSAFVSYASQDRNRVAMIVQGMQKARPDMDIFFDVESLRSGESWEEALWSEIDRRDTLFLCWSRNAAESPWVAREWKYCYEQKGAEAIEPIPLEPPSSCPPPEELKRKHFNDRLLYLIKAESNNKIKSTRTEEPEDTWDNSYDIWD